MKNKIETILTQEPVKDFGYKFSKHSNLIKKLNQDTKKTLHKKVIIMRSNLVFHAILSFFLAITIHTASSMSLANCPATCGNVTIPYPFGIGSNCSANSSFTIICDQNSTNGPRPFLSSINLEVANISVRGTITVNQPVSTMNCTSNGVTRVLGESLSGTPFVISAHYNSFANIGCANSVWLTPNRTDTVGGCMAICNINTNDTSCNGINCCQISLPDNMKEVRFTYQTIRPYTDRTCGYAIMVDRNWFQHDYRGYRQLHTNLSNPFDQDFRYAPVVLDWEYDGPIDSYEGTCRDRTDYPDTYRSFFFDQSEYGSSTRQCYCRRGFEGNPYLFGGCTDIDECSRNETRCFSSRCRNLRGSYACGIYTDNKSRVKMPLIGVGSGLGALLLLIGAWRCYRVVRRRIKANRRQKFFKRNGGLLLEQQVSSSNNSLEKGKLFTAKELNHATDQYNENRVLGGGGQGTVYKGMLIDGRIVAIKKSKKVEEGDLEDFINEVVILSQINHRNIVKLMGCCLETEVPTLVYEFIPNGTLFQHIHDPSDDFSLSWEMRLQIATDVAGALSYLHSAASAPIYHRDVKSTNILLDNKYRAKVADFGTSRSISIEQTHLTTRVLGTFGYLDPEYFQSSQFTDKSDVYSFGVVMVELLTGEKAISSVRAEVGRSLATHFLHSMEDNLLLDILDERVVKEGTKEELFATAELARKCLHLNGKQRPTMKEVATRLERIQTMKKGPMVIKPPEEDREFYTIDLAEDYDCPSISESMRFDTGSDSLDVHPLLLSR